MAWGKHVCVVYVCVWCGGRHLRTWVPWKPTPLAAVLTSVRPKATSRHQAVEVLPPGSDAAMLEPFATVIGSGHEL